MQNKKCVVWGVLLQCTPLGTQLVLADLGLQYIPMPVFSAQRQKQKTFMVTI